jgi:tRNA G18 (ribose-2'-O)-methylase SpoU
MPIRSRRPNDRTGGCECGVSISMKLGTDSLNVAVAAAVFLFHLNGPG